MRLVSFGDRGSEQAGVLMGDSLIALADLAPTLPRTVKGLLAGAHLAALRAALTAYRGPVRASGSVRLGPPITDPGKIICIGLNYHDHAREQNLAALPAHPLLFSKASTSLNGPHDPIELPAGDGGPDYEVELALVIARRCRGVTAADAHSVIAGYMVANDVTCRRWQKADGQWFRAKSPDTFFPCGPALVTADEVGDPAGLRLTTMIDGQTLQNGSVNDLIHDIPALIAYISRDMTLEPGDIISTGTPAGVGCWRNPPRFLRSGDTVTCAILGSGVHLGVLRNPVAARGE